MPNTSTSLLQVVDQKRHNYNTTTMTDFWKPIDSGCCANDTSVPTQDQDDCTFVLVPATRNAVGNIWTLRPRPSPELGEGPILKHRLPVKKVKPSKKYRLARQPLPAMAQVPEDSSIKVSSFKEVHLRMRFNASTNPFLKEEKESMRHSSPLSLASLLDRALTDDDFSLAPRTPEQCVTTAGTPDPPPCHPVHESTSSHENPPPHTLLPNLQ